MSFNFILIEQIGYQPSKLSRKFKEDMLFLLYWRSSYIYRNNIGDIGTRFTLGVL